MRYYKVTARCFEDVIERYRDHALAHYLMAAAYEQIGSNEMKVRENFESYKSIIAKTGVWKSHTDILG